MTETLERSHTRIAPSSLHITTPCPGSVILSEAMPVLPRTEEELEGDAAHWVALWAAYHQLELTSIVGLKAPNDVEITDEMIDGALLYVETVGANPGAGEVQLAIPRIHPTECGGTPDWWTWDAANKVLRVIDYKFGFRFVEVWECHQLVAYAVGLMDFLGLAEEDCILELTVVQPRSYHPDGPVRTWRVAPSKLRAFVNVMHSSAVEALGPNPSTHTGAHCLDCKARAACLTYQQTTGGIIDYSGKAQPNLQTPDDVCRELALVMDARQRLKGRETGLMAMAEHFGRMHKPTPGFSMQSKPGRLKWLDDVSVTEAEDMLRLLTNGEKSALKPPALMTPTQTKKLLGKAGADIVDMYANRPNGAMQLVRDNMAKLSRIFQK
jgi:hypothetical protein